jgi:predicted nucleotide-binding protein (sugar kinase/HSP70/actin superfamily)
MAEDFCRRVGIGFVAPSPYTQATIERGVAASPEHFCFPMKVLIGSAMESLEAGADTLVTIAGYGACRFNYFAELQRRILEREGCEFQIVAFDSPFDSLPAFYRSLRAVTRGTGFHLPGLARELSLVLDKGHALDEISKKSMALRALEAEDGAVDRAAGECLALLEEAFRKDEIDEARRAIASRFDEVPLDLDRPHVKVGVIGELMMSIEPYFNLDIERWLAKNGAVVERSIYMSDLMTPFGHNPVQGWTDEEMEKSASPYLCHGVGGHGQINVAAAVDYARRGFDAIIHFFPFTCLPEVIAKTIFVRLSSELGIPVLSVSIDEQTGRGGMQTRLEALLDLAWSTKRMKGSDRIVPCDASNV